MALILLKAKALTHLSRSSQLAECEERRGGSALASTCSLFLIRSFKKGISDATFFVALFFKDRNKSIVYNEIDTPSKKVFFLISATTQCQRIFSIVIIKDKRAFIII